MTTKLLKRIDDESEAARQEAWAERREFGRAGTKRNPVWACTSLARVGELSAEQADAANRYASAIERSACVGGGVGERVDGGNDSADIHARLWDAAVCRSIVLDGRLWVLRSRTAQRTRMQVFDKLFACPHPTMAQMRVSPCGDRYPSEFAIRRIVGVLDLLVLFWEERDRGYGR